MRTAGNRSFGFFVVLALAAAAPMFVSAQVNYPPYGPNVPPVSSNNTAPAGYPAPKSRTEQSNWNMELAGHNELQGRSAYQPIIISQGGRFIAYVGHHATQHMPVNTLTGKPEPSGTSIVDVTDPANTRYLAHIPAGGPPTKPGEEVGGAQFVRVCSGDTLPRGVKGQWYLLRAQESAAHEIWNVTDPSKPTFLKTVVDGLTGTHKSWWECDTGIAYLVANKSSEGWTGGNHLKIYDLSDPLNPVYIRDFGLLGSQPGATAYIGHQKGIGIHGPISAGPKANRVYIAYGTGGEGVVQIVDRQKLLTAFKNPLNPTDEEMLAPQIGVAVMSPDQGAHTVMPLLDVPVPSNDGHPNLKTRDLIIVSSEQGREGHCGVSPRPNDPLSPHMAFLLDISNEHSPWNLSTFHVDQRVGDFCGRGGRFGNHAGSESFYPPYYGKLAVLSWFNAGTRVFDIRDPFSPKEVGYFIPAPNRNTMSFCDKTGISHADGNPAITADCVKVIQTNNVEIDDRGLIYSADRAGTGLHIMRLTGAAAAAVARPGTN